MSSVKESVSNTHFIENAILLIPIIIFSGLKIRGLDETPVNSLSINERIDKNLDQMYGNISTLKNLALELGTEIEYQNNLIEDITYKADKADITIKKQTKEMNRLMK